MYLIFVLFVVVLLNLLPIDFLLMKTVIKAKPGKKADYKERTTSIFACKFTGVEITEASLEKLTLQYLQRFILFMLFF